MSEPVDLAARADSDGYAAAKESGKMPKLVPNWIDEIDNGDQALIDAFMAGAKRWLDEQGIVLASEPEYTLEEKLRRLQEKHGETNKEFAQVTTMPGAVKANPNASTVIADAVAAALNNTQGQVTTGDGLVWEVNRTSLNKMVSATNQDGLKAYQRERIIAIQHLAELAKAAVNPVVRGDDGRDEQVEAILEYNVPFVIEEKSFNVRLLCKKMEKAF